MKPARILVVEDEAIIARELKNCLAELGYDVVGRAASGEQAIKLAEQQRPDLVLMDIHLQGAMDGISAAEEIRGRFQLPVVFLTSFSDDRTLERAKLALPFGYILKPFDARDLKSGVEIALYKHRSEEEIRRLDRLYDVLTQVNEAIVRSRSRDELLQGVCRVIVEHGGVDLAWIGRLDPVSSRVIPIAHYALHEDILKELQPGGEGQAHVPDKLSQVIVSGEPLICHTCSGDDCPDSALCHCGRFRFKSCGAFPILSQGQGYGVLCLGRSEAGFFRNREQGLLRSISTHISYGLDKMDADIRRRQTETTLRDKEELLRLFIEHAPASMAMFDREMRYLAVSRRWKNDYNLGDREIIGLSHYEVFPEISESWKDVHSRSLAGEVLRSESDCFIRADGSVQWLRWEVRPWHQSGGAVGGIVIFSEDITELKQSELSLGRSLERVGHLNDVLGSLREISSLLNREQNRQSLLDGVCRCLMHTRGYVTVWVGEPDEASGEVKIVAHSGSGASIRLHAPIRWDESALGQGPAGTALRERRPVVFANLADDPRFAPWLDPVLAAGAASIASVPVIHLDRLFGVITVKADKLNAFDAEEVALLKGLAEDVGRVLQAMEDQSERELAHAALRESEQRLALAASGARIGMFEWNIAAGESFWNEQVPRLLGICTTTTTTTTVFTPYRYADWAECVHPEDLPRLENEVHRCMLESAPYEEEYRVVWPDGSVHWISTRGLFQYDRQSRPSLMRGIVMDITERKQVQDALISSEHRFRSLFENMLEGFAHCRMIFDDRGNPVDFVYLDVNRAFESLTGLRNVVGKKVTESIPGIMESHPELFEIYGRVALSGRPENIIMEFRPLAMWLSISIYSSEEEHFVAVFENITERKRMEDELRENERLLSYHLEGMKRLQSIGAMFIKEANLEPILEGIVEAAIAISNADYGNIQLIYPNSSDLRIVAQRGFPDWWIDFWNNVAKGQGACGTALERGGRVIIEDVRQSPVFIGTDALGIQLKAGVRAVQSTPLFSRSGDMLGMFSTHYKMPRRLDDHELGMLDLLARQTADILERARIQEAMQETLRGLEMRVQERTAELSSTNAALIAEIAERRSAEETLRDSEERFRSLFDNSLDGIFFTSPEGPIFAANRAACDILGWSEQEICEGGRNLAVDTSDPRLPAALEERKRTGRFRGELNYRRKDGTVFPVEVASSSFLMQSGEMRNHVTFRDISERKALELEREQYYILFNTSSDLMAIFNTRTNHFLKVNPSGTRILGYSEEEFLGQPYSSFVHPDDRQRTHEEVEEQLKRGFTMDFENRYLCKDGSVCWLSWRATLDKNNGTAYATARDITERKRAEETIAASLAEKEVLLKEIHHRVKNNLAAIASLANLQMKRSLDEKTREAFRDFSVRIKSMALVHEDLYGSQNLSRIDAASYFEKLVQNLMHIYTRTPVKIAVEAGDETIDIDIAVPCGLIATELVTNALKYAFPEGRPGEGDDTLVCRVRVVFGFDGQYYSLSVSDNGIALPAGFDGEHTSSLGLELVRMLGTVQLKGAVEVDSRQGLTVTIKFPKPKSRRHFHEPSTNPRG
jgi:PAS domain S-box-containing protein